MSKQTQQSKFSTSTIDEKGCLVPWLSADGSLSYTPENPPDRNDYYFQYSWIIPGIFNPKCNLRRHYYFGAPYRSNVRMLFEFWSNARRKDISRVAYCHGKFDRRSIDAPIAVYRIQPGWRGPQFLFIQHGSYQIVPLEDQPLLESGEVVLYRGIEKADTYRLLQIDIDDLVHEKAALWKRYITTQSFILSDSVRSFNSIHDRAKRCETSHILDSSWISDDIAREHSLDLQDNEDAKKLWQTTHQSFSLARWVADRKFGPNYIVGKTTLSNIRLTTFFAGEHEVRIIRPDRIAFLETAGCDIEQENW